MSESRPDRVKGRLHRRVQAFAAQHGYRGPGAIPDDMTFRAWCEDLGAKGLKIDRKPFRLDDRPALVPLYDAIPTHREEAFQQMLIIQKATQLGLTVWEVLANIYMALKWRPLNIGMFLPDQNTASFKSEHRFMPIVRSHPSLHGALTVRDDEQGNKRKVGEGNILTRQLGDSLLMFLWTSGKVTTESRPMDVATLDEVQGMTLDQIDKVLARLGDSLVQFALMLSTANMPDADIDFWYRLGSQEVWHTLCKACGEESDLSDPAGIFPARSIAYNRGEVAGAPIDDYVWTCPACRAWIPNPQHGRYVPQNPGASRRLRSFLIPRTISPRITPRDMFEGFQRAKTGEQKKSFYNRTLARPYIDADQLPVTMDHCLAAARAGVEAGLRWEKAAAETYMGIDQMGGWNAHIIKRRMPDGRQAVVHVEATWGEEPFTRSAELMRAYGVAACVVEQLPNVNSARAFANRFPGRVFLAGYSPDPKADMMTWGDAITRSDRKTAVEDRSRYTVVLQQYKAMQLALHRIRDGFCLFPDPDGLEQDVQVDGVTKRVPLLRDWVFLHYTKTALIVEQHPETRAPKPQVRKVGLDPHFSYATMLCDVAWSRVHGAGSFVLPQAPTPSAAAQGAAATMPGLPQQVANMLDALPDGVCGSCAAFRGGHCAERGLNVGARDPGCPMYVPRQQDSQAS